MRIVFMGTPDIARHCLQELLQAKKDVVAVYTRADKPIGRKQVLTAPPVKQLAQEHHLMVYQPKNLRGEESFVQLCTLSPDLIVVVAYGRLLPKEVLELPKYGCINLHVSCLPQYRGAAPIQWAVIDGCPKTGVSIMQLDEGLDTGDLLCTQEFEIDDEATAGEVLCTAAQVGGKLLVKVIDDIENGKVMAEPQHGCVSLAPQLNKDMAKLDCAKPARELHNLVRGCNPWPLAWVETDGKRIKILRTRVSTLQGKVGEVLQLKPLVLGCGEGALELVELVPEGKKAMSGTQWAQGKRLQLHDCLTFF